MTDCPNCDVIFDEFFFTTFSQFYITLGDTYDTVENTVSNQCNGLLRAAFPTLLHIVVGQHTGRLRLRVEHCTEAPDLDPTWEEVTEASFVVPPNTELCVHPCIDGDFFSFKLPSGTYRVRYCARHFGLTDQYNPDLVESCPIDERYQLTFWLAPKSHDEILRVTSPSAEYWHKVAQGKA